MRIAGVIGDPIAHSRSPAMQNAAFRKAGLPNLYLPFHVRRSELARFMKEVRGWGFLGLNVTIPHKETVIRHLDGLSARAREIGAVNTIVRRGRRWIGDNTDGVGYLRSLEEETLFRPRGKRVVLLGAGGAARAVAVSLLRAGARELVIANRTVSRAQRLAKRLNQADSPRRCKVVAISLVSRLLRRTLAQADLVINATPVGWRGTRFRRFPLRSLRRGAIVSDLVYWPDTPFLRAARERGHRVHAGLGMLVHQGAESFRLWTGRRPDRVVMRRTLTVYLAGGSLPHSPSANAGPNPPPDQRTPTLPHRSRWDIRYRAPWLRFASPGLLPLARTGKARCSLAHFLTLGVGF